MSLSQRDYPVIDTTLKFCDMYLHRGVGLVELLPQSAEDRVIYKWLSDLEAAAKMAETTVLIANFRGDARERSLDAVLSE